MNTNKIWFVLIATIFLISCDLSKEKNDYKSIVEKTKINSAFEMQPPIAKEIKIEILESPTSENENIRLVATFEKNEIQSSYLALLIDNQKVVLRDDGKGADNNAHDGNFSILIKENIKKLQSELLNRQKQIIKNDSLVTFDRRRMKFHPIEDIKKFQFGIFTKNEEISIPIGLLPLNRPPRTLSQRKQYLLIVDTKVVEDPTRTFNPCATSGNQGNPNGVWTFGELMRQLASPSPNLIANDAQVSAFVRDWLSTWTSQQTINGETVAARNISNVLSEWEDRSGLPPSGVGVLDMKFAPMKLTAIVNRLDLRGNSGYGFSNAGEGRFVFTVLDNCHFLGKEFNIILEYGINKTNCTDLVAYAQEWENLNNLTIGTPAYNAALENITNQFTQCGTNTSKPNESSLNQLRTNEIALNSPWELREFVLTNTGLSPTTVKQEPAVKYNNKFPINADVQRLERYINSFAFLIKRNKHTVPEKFEGEDFLGGKAHTEFPPVGNHPSYYGTRDSRTQINDHEALRSFSENTCSGCHAGSTQTAFTHVDPAGYGQEAALSGFLTGIAGSRGFPIGGIGGDFPTDDDGNISNNIMTVLDPFHNIFTYTSHADMVTEYNDLLRREMDLNNLLNNNCTIGVIELAAKLTFDPLRMTH
ncbi:hypothetical protein [Kriegella aquimaris]|uniref:Uncharacterized protein n=1 Tax=Kriegella aquimaris TaxID=192904 RepID=A0A1G9V0M4_9FLAO|nr:hypothetical protein [Kriegella aquimaris]SDM65762.1 hypothetical protein SAMN04488514_11263 [Kriegella aquimaris]